MLGRDKDSALAKARTSMLDPSTLMPVQLGEGGFDPKGIAKGPLSKAAQKELDNICDRANIDAARSDISAKLNLLRRITDHNSQAAGDLLDHIAAQQRDTLQQLAFQAKLNVAVSAGQVAGAGITACRGINSDVKDSVEQSIKSALDDYLRKMMRD